MKERHLLFAFLIFLPFVSACDKEDDPEPVAITESDFTGEWEITSFSGSSQVSTASLEAFSFEIFSNSDFIVKKGTIDSYGTWSVDEDAMTFTVSLSNPKAPADVIDGAWKVYGKTETSLWLKSFGQDTNKEFRLTKI